MFAMMLKFKIQNPSYSLQAALGAKFESLFGMMLTNVKYFVFFVQPCLHPECWTCSNKSQGACFLYED
jgi:hypothetical protein